MTDHRFFKLDWLKKARRPELRRAKENGVETPTLKITINNHNPIELIDFTKSLLAVGDQFKREADVTEASDLDVRLFVREMRPGSIIAELIPMVQAGAALAAADLPKAMVAVKSFIDTVDQVRKWFVEGGEKPVLVDTKKIENVSQMLEPVAKDHGANISIEVHGDLKAPIAININTLEANTIQNRSKAYLAELKTPKAQVYEQALMYWDQVKNLDGRGEGPGEKAVIEKISPKPVKVVFVSASVRDQMLFGSPNPLKEGYIVDVEAQTVRGKIAAYKVVRLHERFAVEDDAAGPAEILPPPAG